MKTLVDHLLYLLEKVFSYLYRIADFLKFYLLGFWVLYIAFWILKLIFTLLFQAFLYEEFNK